MRRNVVIFFSICVVKCLAMSRSELEDFSNFLEMTSQLDSKVKSYGPDDAFDEDEIVSDNAWEESGKFEGDLILNERQRRLLIADVAEGLSRNGLQDSTKRWPNNEVIYYIQKEHFSSGQVQAIQEGIDDLAQASCVKFTPYKKGDRDAVVIQGSRRGCFSQVGYQGGYQVLNLSGRHPVGRGCFRHGTVVHELLHALGFYHMQSSPDRDDYIEVHWQNIIQQARHNFRKYNSFSVSDFGVGYDYESVLHYSRKAFSSNGQDTLVPKQRGAAIGQRVGLSQKDIQKLNRMYCDADSNDSSDSDDLNKTKKPVVIKKNAKNKPFDGHGIGYHQGKTVVIKIKPTVELYGLPTLPKFHMFDSFSKAPQALSPPLDEKSRSGKKMTYLTNVPASKSLIPSTVEDQKKYFDQMSHIGNSAQYDEGKVDKNNQTPVTVDLIDINEYLEKANKDMQSYPDYSDYNHDYSEYFHPERPRKKEPEIIKVDKLFKSSGLVAKDLVSNEQPDLRTIPLDNKELFKNLYSNHERSQGIASLLPYELLSIKKEKSAQSYPLREFYYNPEERDIPEFKSPINYLRGELKINDTNDDGYVSLKKYVPTDEEWYTNDKYKQNPNENYDKESYTYDPDRKKENSNMESLPMIHYYGENVYNSDASSRKPYLLFDAPIPLTHKWYKRDDTGH